MNVYFEEFATHKRDGRVEPVGTDLSQNHLAPYADGKVERQQTTISCGSPNIIIEAHLLNA